VGLAAGLLMGLPLAAGAAQAASPKLAATGFLAVTTGAGSSQISSFKIDGSGQQKLTKGPANHYSPAISPDGKLVLYEGEDGGGFGIYRMSIDGTGVVALTSPPTSAGSPNWSPDGSAIAYSARPGTGSYQIYVAKPDGSGATALTKSTDGQNGQPAFSPDGAQIAFINTIVDATGQPVSRIWLMTSSGSDAHAISAGPTDGYPAWLDNSTLMFARSSSQGTLSQVFSLTAAGVEKPASPAGQFFTEPRPLPDGKTYGATYRAGSAFELVKVSRVDGAPLAAAAGSVELLANIDGYVVTPIVISDGDTFTIVWILTPVSKLPPGRNPSPPGIVTPATPPPVPWIVLVVVVVVLLGGGVFWRLRTSGPPPATTPPPGTQPPIPGLPEGVEVTGKPLPIPTDPDDVPCDYNEGWHIMLKYERSEPYGFWKGVSEEDAARRGDQYLRNRLTNEEPGIRKFLQDWADGIQCRAPCVKHVIWEEAPVYWEEPKDHGNRVVCYMRAPFGIVVECRSGEAQPT
jgi:hypothetical protein